MTDYTKHNAKIAQEFWKKVEEGADPDYLWSNELLIDKFAASDTTCEFLNFDSYFWLFSWKPETITIHGREVPKPMTEKPGEGCEYYYHISFQYRLFAIRARLWDYTEEDDNHFAKGIFDNREDCEKFAEAYYRPWQELVE